MPSRTETHSILLADPDADFAADLADGLVAELSVRTDVCPNLGQLPDRLRSAQPDVLVMGGDWAGFTPGLCRRLRREYSGGLLVLTVPRDERTKIGCLNNGADACLDKTSSAPLVAAALEALLRRVDTDEPPRAVQPQRRNGYGAGRPRPIRLELDETSRQVRIGRRLVPLTASEYKLLAALAAKPGQAVSREALRRAVRGRCDKRNDRTVDVLVVRLRKKIGQVYDTRELIRTVPQVGYELIN